MDSFFTVPRWSLGGLVVALAVLFTLVATDASLAHPSVKGEEQSADIQQQEVQLDATYFQNNGSLDGLTVTANGLAVADGQTSGVYVSDVIQTSLGLVSDIVPIWKAGLADEADLLIETRMQVDGSWSDWEANPYAYYPVRDDEFSGNLIWVGNQQATLQMRVTLQGASTLEHVTFFFNNTSSGPTDAQIATQKAGQTEIASNTCPLNRPAVVSRTEWGNPEGQYSPRRAPVYAPVTHIIVHHSETPNSNNYATVVRSIWNFHANILRWGDTGYNYMIDPNGVIYEGRAGGDDVIGIHDTHNRGSMSIGFLGCYGGCDNPRLPVYSPSQEMMESGIELMSWKLGQKEIDPQSSAPYNRYYNVPVIAGGRDVVNTTSPGYNIYNVLPRVREDVAENVPCEDGPTPTPTDDPDITPTPTDDTPIPTTETPTSTPTPVTPTATPAPLFCTVTGIFFDQSQYLVGDTINLTLRLADADGNPLAGANVDVDVTKTVALEAQAFHSIGFVDRTGEYDGSYANTDVAGSYKFSFRASDPTGTRFAPCTTEEFVLVVAESTSEPTPTETSTPATVTPTETSTPATVTPTETSTPATVTPTETSTPTTVTPTPTNTPVTPVTPIAPNSLSFDEQCTEPGETTNLQITNADQIRGVELEIRFDPTVGQVASITENPDLFSHPNGLVLPPTIDNTNGVINFSATTYNGSVNDTDTLLTINWDSINGGPSQIRVENLELVDQNDVDIAVAPGEVDPGYIANDCSSVTAGTVVLQGRTDNSGTIINTVGGQQIETGVSGNFLIIGDSIASISTAGYLNGQLNEGTGVTSTNAQGDNHLEVGTMTLLAGDVNNDNTVNIFDLTYMASRLYTDSTDADLNGDGQVDIFDLSLAANNFNQNGPLTEWN